MGCRQTKDLSLWWRRGLVVLVSAMFLNGCSAYQGAIHETTITELKRTVGPGQKRLAVFVREGVLVVERFDVHEVEIVPVVTTAQTYARCAYKPPVMEFKAPGGGPRLANGEELLSFWFSYFLDMVDSDSACSRPAVPILSRVACAALPLVSCSGTPGASVTDTSASEGQRATETMRTRRGGTIRVEAGGTQEDVSVDGSGTARLPLTKFAVAALSQGQERLTVRVSVRD